MAAFDKCMSTIDGSYVSRYVFVLLSLILRTIANVP